MEYGLWFWVLLVLLVLTLQFRRNTPKPELRTAFRNLDVLVPLCITIVVVAQVSFYSFVVGGDHFEYRVYSYTIPLVLVNTVWMVNYLVERRCFTSFVAVIAPVLVVALALPIPWTYRAKAQKFTTRRETGNLTIPLTQSFPVGIRWYIRSFDGLQRWLIRDHAIGKRHQEHKIFLEHQLALFPRKRLMGDEWYDEHRVFLYGPVGVAGWILARAYVIDKKGLNDYVIARNPVPRSKTRRMAHDRSDPLGYVQCYKPNVVLGISELYSLDSRELASFESPGFFILPRPSPLTSEEIEDCEQRWRTWIKSRPKI
jgi:arabinofuranosyltransferase